jgi:ketosteroid isomerase-like protein
MRRVRPAATAVVSRFYAALNARELDAVAALLAEDVRWRVAHHDLPPQGVAGRDRVLAFLRAPLPDPVLDVTTREEETVALPPLVLVRGRHVLRLASGGELEIAFTHAWRVSPDGLLLSLVEVVDRRLPPALRGGEERRGPERRERRAKR